MFSGVESEPTCSPSVNQSVRRQSVYQQESRCGALVWRSASSCVQQRPSPSSANTGSRTDSSFRYVALPAFIFKSTFPSPKGTYSPKLPLCGLHEWVLRRNVKCKHHLHVNRIAGIPRWHVFPDRNRDVISGAEIWRKHPPW